MSRTTWAAALTLIFLGSSTQAGWQAGVSRAVITPAHPMWMSGYASREHTATGKLTELWAKALVLQDDAGRRAVMVSLDLVGIDRQTAVEIREQLASQHGLTTAEVAICTSHTHSGPVVGTNLIAMYSLDDNQLSLIRDYTNSMKADVVRIVGEAIDDLAPAEVSFGVGRCTFAVNRRENRAADVPQLREHGALKGPVDHEAPVLSVTRDGDLAAVLFGYACHATTLNGYDWCGDWPGYAQIALEKAHPGTTALFFTGCGADQNPLPRRTVELAEAYGLQMAQAVDRVLASKMKSLKPSLQTQYEEIDLPFAHVPVRKELEQALMHENKYEVRRARHLLARLESEQIDSLPPTYPYPIQTWQLGDVTGVILGGEVVVDYSLAIKGLPQNVDFVAGYANDVMAYIASERVLGEGGYEGGGAMVYYGLPSPWASGAEGRIMDSVKGQLDSLAP